MAENKPGIGRVVQVIGPVLDIQFEQGHLPAIFSAVRIVSEGFDVPEPLDVTVEVQQHLGERQSTRATRSKCQSAAKRSAA